MPPRDWTAGRPRRRCWRWSEAAGHNGDAVEAATTEHIHDDLKRDSADVDLDDQWIKLTHGDVVIAAITSCTNTSNPSVMVAAGLLAKKAVEKGLTRSAVCENVAGPGQPGGDRLSEQSGTDAVSGSTWIQHGGLRLHHLHRQQRPAAGGDRQGGREPRPGGGGGALRQSQFRRPDQSARQGQLSGQPAAGGGLRPGRDGGCEHHGRAASPAAAAASRSSCAKSGPARPRSREPSPSVFPRTCSAPNTPTSKPATTNGTRSR